MPRIEKVRFKRDGWEIDFLKGAYNGMILAEKEMASEDEAVSLPPWIPQGIEVSEWLDNGDLALIDYDLANIGETDTPIGNYAKSLPRVVLLGASRQSALETLGRRLAGALVVPELTLQETFFCRGWLQQRYVQFADDAAHASGAKFLLTSAGSLRDFCALAAPLNAWSVTSGLLDVRTSEYVSLPLRQGMMMIMLDAKSLSALRLCQKSALGVSSSHDQDASEELEQGAYFVPRDRIMTDDMFVWAVQEILKTARP